MEIEDVCDIITMKVMARGLMDILESEGSASCKPGNQAFNEMSTGVSWLYERLDEFVLKLMQEV